jgi:hypothetical protein
MLYYIYIHFFKIIFYEECHCFYRVETALGGGGERERERETPLWSEAAQPASVEQYYWQIDYHFLKFKSVQSLIKNKGLCDEAGEDFNTLPSKTLASHNRKISFCLQKMEKVTILACCKTSEKL